MSKKFFGDIPYPDDIITLKCLARAYKNQVKIQEAEGCLREAKRIKYMLSSKTLNFLENNQTAPLSLSMDEDKQVGSSCSRVCFY
jgi:hypothetical protein